MLDRRGPFGPCRPFGLRTILRTVLATAGAMLVAAVATNVGMARRHGVTLIVTLLHCPALTEIDAGKSLLNWGFAVDGKVRPVGTLVGPLPPPGSTSAPSRSGQQGTGQQADWAQPVASGGPSVPAAAGFSCVALLAAGIGFAYSAHSRRRRSRS